MSDHYSRISSSTRIWWDAAAARGVLQICLYSVGGIGRGPKHIAKLEAARMLSVDFTYGSARLRRQQRVGWLRQTER